MVARILLCCGFTILSGAIAPRLVAAEAPSPEQLAFFEQRIRPVLVQHCYECHSAKAKSVKGGLLLDSKPGWERGGESGEKAILPGQPDDSLLIRVIRHQEAGMEMPPEQPKLAENIIADLAEWVRIGAPDPRLETVGEAKRADKSWWSLQPLQEAAVPSPSDLPTNWAANPIDHFIFDKLAAAGLTPSVEADRRTLIRRATYDLTGLPPTPEEVAEFVADPAPDTYERLIDRLLESPHYGERWGRHWLDVVRFGESRGFERNEIIQDAWPFRDYVIRSFNDDKPFNRFIVEHLAGDVVAADDPQNSIGVAFLTIGPYDDVGNQDAVQAANIRAATVDDMVTATGSAFLGLTINCARCHNHKFDPIPTEDYYRIKCALDGVSHGSRPWATAKQMQDREAATRTLGEQRAEFVRQKEAIRAAILALADQAGAKTYPRPAPSARLTEESFPAVEARFARLTILATSDNPRDGGNGRLDEFEVWTSEETPRNVALASAGGVATGTAGRGMVDFGDPYGIQLVNDGKYAARWFAGSPAVLTLEWPFTETIDRITFSHDRTAMSDLPIAGQGPSIAEYELHVSEDGHFWTKVADSFDRAALNEPLAVERKLKAFTTPEDVEKSAELDRQIAQVDAQLGAIPPLPTAWMGHFGQPGGPTPVFRGGDPQQPNGTVAPSSLAVLERCGAAYELPADAPESERRLALAKWLASDDNALTGRVLVNRLWHYHFGTGIVDTPGDFGFLGGKPTHPELLDWLVHRLHANGWKLKPLHREIMLSQAYRQSSANREEAAHIDHDSRLLWRFPPQRLDAEEVRDTMLQAAGLLNLQMGGPGYRLYAYQSDNVSTYRPLDQVGPETYRRAVYHQNVRASTIDVLSDFDLPDNAFAVPKRSNTTTPLQALTLLNHSFLLDLANAMAARAEREAGPERENQIRRLYQLAYQRDPSAEEQKAAMDVANEDGLRAVCRAILNSNELLFVD